MSLSDLASFGSFVSGAAVLVSLVFLYFQLRQLAEQVRQAERNQRATILQVKTNRTADRALRVCDPSVADAYTNATRCSADLTFTQLQQFAGIARAMFLDAEDAFNQRRDGLLTPHDYSTLLVSFRRNLAVQAYRSSWRLVWRDYFGPDFVAFVDQMLMETPVGSGRAPTDLLAAWKADFAASDPAR
jgi:hypothetical protein